MLTFLKETGHSHPGNMTEQEWENILTEMIEGFQNWPNHYVMDVEDQEEAYKKVHKSLRLLIHWFGDLWD